MSGFFRQKGERDEEGKRNVDILFLLCHYKCLKSSVFDTVLYFSLFS